MRHVSLMLLAFGAVLAAGPTWAADGDGASDKDLTPYIVRYLVFQHRDYWDNPLLARGPKKEKPEPSEMGNGLPDPEADGDPMDKLWQRLSASDRYRPLIQGLAVPLPKPKDKAKPIDIAGSWPASIRSPFAAMNGPVDRPMRVLLGQGWAPPGVDGNWNRDRVRGTLLFYKGRYAHLAVNLDFTEQRRWMPWGIDTRHNFLQQSRRLLPNRFYYFDHPRFGVIARIERME